MVIDTEERSVLWRRVAYEVGTTQDRMREAKLPSRLIDRLRHGL
jgi:hypothetical protein